MLHHSLVSLSPWRRLTGRAQVVSNMSERSDRKVMQIDALPRVSPFRLEWGPRALATAREATLRWLDAPA